MYCLFVLLLGTEVLSSVVLLPTEGNWNVGVGLWLFGEGLYYLLIRWLERRANRTLLPQPTL